MGLGSGEGVTQDALRHDTTTRFVALGIQTGDVIAACEPRHCHLELLPFLRHLEQAEPARFDVHPLFDTDATHTPARVKA